MHIINCKQFKIEDVEEIFRLTDKQVANKFIYTATRKIMASLFYEPSTRTRFSFETAMYKLGGNVISTENAMQFSSHTKGEVLEDTIQVVSRYADVIVLRHPMRDAAAKARDYSRVPVINAGDGDEHPTQGLLDVYTIRRALGDIIDKKIVLVGDLKYSRTIHSLIILLNLYSNLTIHLVSPESLLLPKEYKDLFKKTNKAVEWRSLRECLKNSKPDVIYMTRLQKERFVSEDKEALHEAYLSCYLGPEEFNMSGDAIIMHPLPRNDEISPYVDSSKRALYLTDQIDNGLAIRTAILYKIFSK